MGEGGEKLFLRLGEAFFIENLRILPVLRRMVRAVDEHNDCRSPGNIDVASAIVCEGHSVYHPKWRIKAQRLHDDLSRKLELWNVGVTQGPITQHDIELLPCLLDTVRTRAEQ